MTQHLINSEPALDEFISWLITEWRVHHYLRVKVKTGRDRSLDQNAIGHVWYGQVVAELREDNALGVKRFCKLHFGCPILCAEDETFREFFDSAIAPLPYEKKLKAMDMVDVTSIMTVQQHSAYLVAMQDHYKTRHVTLEFPEKPARFPRRAAA